MSQILNWVKSNPISVLCLLVIVLACGSFVWPTRAQGRQFVEKLEQRSSKIGQIDNLIRTRRRIPPQNPDDEETDIWLTVNRAAIDRLKEIHQVMGTQYKEVFGILVDFNRRDDRIMFEGVFPKPVRASTPFNARDDHPEAYVRLLEGLGAGAPVDKEAMSQRVKEIIKDHALRTGESEARRSGVMDTELEENKRKELLSLIRGQAQSIQIYADPPYQDPTSSVWNTTVGSLTLGKWVHSSSPTMFELWEAQMALWIQQDIAEAIRRVNGAGDSESTVIGNPVKHIVRVKVPPLDDGGLVGLNIRDTDLAKKSDDSGFPNHSGRSRPDMSEEGAYTGSVTGRKCNALYDVIHTDVELVVDAMRIPELLKAFSEVNFITVIDMSIVDVDEYASMLDGYYYGDNDVVRLFLTLESIWLRRWTAGHADAEEAAEFGEPFVRGKMPDRVRQALGLEPREEDPTPEPLRSASRSGIR